MYCHFLQHILLQCTLSIWSCQYSSWSVLAGREVSSEKKVGWVRYSQKQLQIKFQILTNFQGRQVRKQKRCKSRRNKFQLKFGRFCISLEKNVMYKTDVLQSCKGNPFIQTILTLKTLFFRQPQSFPPPVQHQSPPLPRPPFFSNKTQLQSL